MLNVVVSNCKVVEFTRYIPLVFANLIPAQGEVDFIQLYVIKYLKKKLNTNIGTVEKSNRKIVEAETTLISQHTFTSLLTFLAGYRYHNNKC